MDSEVISNGKGNETGFNTTITKENNLKTPYKPCFKKLQVSTDITLQFLKKSVVVRFGDIATGSRAMNMNRSELSQILNGLYIPKSIKVIQKLADGLQINPILLGRFFSNERWTTRRICRFGCWYSNKT